MNFTYIYQDWGNHLLSYGCHVGEQRNSARGKTHKGRGIIFAHGEMRPAQLKKYFQKCIILSSYFICHIIYVCIMYVLRIKDSRGEFVMGIKIILTSPPNIKMQPQHGLVDGDLLLWLWVKTKRSPNGTLSPVPVQSQLVNGCLFPK